MPRLPFIFSKKYNMKILIDTGASASVINPDIAFNLFSHLIYSYNFEITTCNKTFQGHYALKLPIFSEFNNNSLVEFLVLPWHNKYDCLLSFKDLTTLGCTIDLKNKCLKTNNLVINYQEDLNNLTIKVNIKEGEVLVPNLYINDEIIPETICIAKNYEIQLPYQINNLNINTPLTVNPLSDYLETNEFKELDTPHLNVNKVIRTSHMNSEEKNKILKLCKENVKVFYNPEEQLTACNVTTHKIRTKDDEPIYLKNFRYPYHLKKEIQNQVKKLLDNKIIKPSISPYSSPVWIVPKKLDASGEKKWRMVIDFRKLNEQTIEDKYPLPRTEEILENLGKSQYFSTLDLAQGFHQIPMDEKSIEKTAFTVENGHWEYVRMPFGLKNAPATFQRMMDHVLREYLHKFCFVYMDDIIVHSKSLDEHILHLKLIFKKLLTHNLKIQLDKSEFLKKEVPFLGHIITPEGIKPNEDKIKSIQNFPLPKTQKEIKSFLGLIGYYRKFIKNFAHISKPFTKCLRKGEKINVNDTDYLEAFRLCKEIICNAPILAYPDFNKTFHLTTDASNVAIGAVLSQDQHPISFYSRTLNSAEKNYSTIEKELLSIVDACKHFRPYIFGQKFIVETDHKPLVWLFSLKEPNQRLIRWKLKLEEYNFDIKHKKGKENVVADALSRIELNALTRSQAKTVVDNDDDLDLLSILPEVDPQEDLSPEDADLILDSTLLAEVPEVEFRDNDSDNETVHTSQENPIGGLPISEKIIHCFKSFIIFNLGDQYKVETLGNNQYSVTLRSGQETEQTINFIKEYTRPNLTYGIHFTDKNLEPIFIKILQTHFDNTLKFVKTNYAPPKISNFEFKEKLKDYHEKTHTGIKETYEHLKKEFWTDKILPIITNYINKCDICLRIKYERRPYNPPFLGPLVAKRPFEHIFLDLFSVEKQSFLTIIDLFSKYAQAYAIDSKDSITIINKLRHYFSHHNIPSKITCDSGNEFNNETLKEFCALFKINLHITTIKNPNSLSPLERLHGTLKERLSTLRLIHKKDSIKDMMITAILIYNQSVHSATGFTPFSLLYGPYDNLNTHELDLNLNIYQQYNLHRKRELLPFYDLIYHKTKDKEKQILTNRNKDKDSENPQLIDKQVYIPNNNRTSKLTPKYRPLQVTSQTNSKLETKDKTISKSFNIRNIKKVRKEISLQDYDDAPDPRDGQRPGPSTEKV